MSGEVALKVVPGHLFNGAPLCPSSLYGDMAITVCRSVPISCCVPVPENHWPQRDRACEVPKTLIFNDTAKSHILRLTATANAKLGYADLVFHTSEGARGRSMPCARSTWTTRMIGRTSSTAFPT